MGHIKCSAFVPWEAVCCPWSCVVQHHHCPMGKFQWSMRHSKCSPFVPRDTVGCPWSFLSCIISVPWACSNGPWEIYNVHPVPGDTVGCPSSCLCLYQIWTMGHFKWSSFVPWDTVLPKVLIFPASHVSHGHIPMGHGTYCVAHGSELSCITFVPWAYTNRPWDVANVHHVSHGHIPMDHGTYCVAHGSEHHICPMGMYQ